MTTKSRMLFRENGHVIRTRRSLGYRLQGAVAYAGIATLLVLLYGWGQAVDDHAAREDESPALIEARAFAQGRALAERDHLASIREAYEQGLNDAMRSVRSRPEGVALTQACMALAAAADATSPRRVGSLP